MAGPCEAMRQNRQNARATPQGTEGGSHLLCLPLFFPQHPSYMVSHPKLHTPSQLFGTEEITTARGVLGPNSYPVSSSLLPLSSPLSLCLSPSYCSFSKFLSLPSPFPFLSLSRFNQVIWRHWVSASQWLIYEKISVSQTYSYIKALKPCFFLKHNHFSHNSYIEY